MLTPTIDNLFTARVGADWLPPPFVFYVGQGGPLDDFAGCSISGGIYQNGRLLLDLSTGSGRSTLSFPATVTIAVDAADIGSLGAGVFDVALALLTPTSQIQDLLDIVLRVTLP